MTNLLLPQKIDPISLANKNACMKGTLLIKDLLRLSDLLFHSDGEIDVTLSFGKDHKNFYFIKGHINAELSLKCQRCLDSVIYKINTDFNLSPISNDKIAETLPGHYEPVLLMDKTLLVADIVEDEIILNLPMAAKHELNMCTVK